MAITETSEIEMQLREIKRILKRTDAIRHPILATAVGVFLGGIALTVFWGVVWVVIAILFLGGLAVAASPSAIYGIHDHAGPHASCEMPRWCDCSCAACSQ